MLRLHNYRQGNVTSERLPPFPEQRQRLLHQEAMIDRLIHHTKHTRDLLSLATAIDDGAAHVQIPRRCVDAIYAAAEGGSLVVTGSPSAGKSVALFNLVDVK